jgi:hypothetical protein
MTKFRLLFPSLIATFSLIATITFVKGQSPQPILVQAATGANSGTTTSAVTTTTTSAQSAAIAQNAAAVQVAIQTLEKIKSANDEVLKRQQATLQQLDELQQAAEELKVFSKRG